MTTDAASHAIIQPVPPQENVWRRRVLLMFIVGLAVAIPVTLLLRGDDDEPAPATTSVVPALNPGVNDKGLDAHYQVPKGWKESRQGGAIKLQSRDKTTLIAIAAPAAASQSEQVLDDAIAGVKSGYRDVDIHPGSGKKVGGLKAKGAVATAKTPDGGALRILIAVAKGKRHTYLVEVFTAANANPQRLAEAQVALNSLQLQG
jgi:hypothetical protein